MDSRINNIRIRIYIKFGVKPLHILRVSLRGSDFALELITVVNVYAGHRLKCVCPVTITSLIFDVFERVFVTAARNSSLQSILKPESRIFFLFFIIFIDPQPFLVRQF